MSTFTQWNGPQCASGPSTKDITDLINAYNNLSVKLTAHIEALAPTDSSVHGIVNYVTDIRNELVALIGGKASNEALDSVRTTANSAATQASLNNAINSMNTLIAGKASNEALNAKADKTTTTALANEIATLSTLVDNLRSAWSAFDSHYVDNTTELAFNCAIRSAEYIIGKIKAHKYVDFTRWSIFSAPFAGTGALYDTSTNGAFILGCLSLNWEDDPNKPAEDYAHKAARAYVKYVNSNPFDAICDMTATKTDDGYVGSLTVHVTKKADTWEDLAFHLIVGTNNEHEECVYLAVSAKGLSTTSGDYSNTDFRACGINFLPVGEAGYVTPSGMLRGITTAYVGAEAESLVSVDKLRLTEMRTDNYYDGSGFNLFRVIKTVDPDTGIITRQVLVGDEHYADYIFKKRPSMILENEQGQEEYGYFITSQDIINMTMPLGAIIRWPLVNPDESLRDIPEGYLACDGTQISEIDYPDLCALLGVDGNGYATLPTENRSIIRATYFDISYSPANPDYENIIEYNTLNNKINNEIGRATSVESGLSNRLSAVETESADTASGLAAEITRATTAEEAIAGNVATNTDNIATNTANIATNTDNIAAEVARATAAEQQNATNISNETIRATNAEQALNTRINNLHPNG